VLVDRAWADGTDVARAFSDSVDATFTNGHSAPDVEHFAAEFARAVAVELARLLGEAAERATAPDEVRTVLDPLARDDKEGRRERTP
jgi:hypothetical protein